MKSFDGVFEIGILGTTLGGEGEDCSVSEITSLIGTGVTSLTAVGFEGDSIFFP